MQKLSRAVGMVCFFLLAVSAWADPPKDAGESSSPPPRQEFPYIPGEFQIHDMRENAHVVPNLSALGTIIEDCRGNVLVASDLSPRGVLTGQELSEMN